MPKIMEPLHITLLAGGISRERDISLASGAQIASALRRRGHTVMESDIAPDNLAALDYRPCDLVFPALHGTFGEDGQLQEILEARALAYVGSGPAASKLAMDKAAAKNVLAENCIATPNWQVVSGNKYKDSWTPRSGIGYPCVVKPISDGSSVACRICGGIQEARAHLAETLPQYGSMLVEKFIAGPELTVGILDGRTLPIIQIRPAAAFYDYQAKYQRNDTEYLFDINLPPALLEKVARMAYETYNCLGARHLARVDIMVDQTSLEPMVLELNSLPGFTSHSLVPKAAAQAGIPFDELCDRLAQMAVRDHTAATRKTPN
ncbi:MAG: D-alanine--D-alanine ligase family protein [Phycisphaerae bacterium]